MTFYEVIKYKNHENLWHWHNINLDATARNPARFCWDFYCKYIIYTASLVAGCDFLKQGVI